MTAAEAGRFTALARLFDYPDEAWRDEILRSFGDESRLAAFCRALREERMESLEEYYCSTFDVDPVLSLACGWHLFGEEYERGMLLARLRAAMREKGVDEGKELPDHLPNLLRLLDAMEPEERAALAGAVVLPAVRRMEEGLARGARVADTATDLALKKKDRELLEAEAPPVSENRYGEAIRLVREELERIPGAKETAEEAEAALRSVAARREAIEAFCGGCRA